MLAVQLLLKRSRPDVLILPVQSAEEVKFAAHVQQQLAANDLDVKCVGVLSSRIDGKEPGQTPVACHAYLTRPYTAEQCLEAVEQALSNEGTISPVEPCEEPSLAACAS